MPEEEKKNEPMVDIDTSGPEVEVNLEQETKQEEPKETLQVEETKEEIKVEETKEPEVKEETEDKKKELEEYSDGVQKRIAKLTKKWREAERQKEAALECVMDQMIQHHWNSLRPMHQNELDRTLVLEMTIETASAKIRDVGVNDEPEDYDTDVWAGIVPIKQVASMPIPDEQLRTGISTPQHVLDYCEQHQ